MRVDLRCNGMIFEDDESIDGCKMHWVIENDIKGSVPKSIINQRALKNPLILVDSLVKACHKIMHGKL